jgi:hypothetical protein
MLLFNKNIHYLPIPLQPTKVIYNIIYKNIIYIKIENEQNTSSNNNENSIAGYINILNIT